MKTATERECNLLRKGLGGEKVADEAIAFDRYDTWFDGAEPWTLSSPEQLRTLRDLEKRFEPIEADGNTQVKIGVASGCDRLYIVEKGAPIEKSRLLPLVMRADLEKGKIRDNSRFVINTFDDCGKVIALEDYPKLNAYFDKHASDIRGRHVAKKNGAGWFRTIDRVYPEFVKRPKLLIPDIAGSNEVTYDPGQYFPHHNLYFILSEKWDLEVLGGLLSSQVALFFVWSYAVKMRGGYLRFQAQYLRRIRVPSPGRLSTELKTQIKNAFRERNFSQLDRLALKAYGLRSLPEFDFVDTRA